MKNSHFVNGIFDKHEWIAGVYDTTERILRAFNSFNICGKRIVSIKAIGASGFEQEAISTTAFHILHDAGVPYEKIKLDRYEYNDQILIPCEVQICEPVVLVFEGGGTFELQPVEKDSLKTNFKDGSTFELQPAEKLSLKMSINQIPSEITDGNNYSNFDANIVFRGLLGNCISEMTVQTFNMESVYNNFKHKEVRRFRRYIFLTSGEFGFSITQRSEAWYYLELRNQRHSSADGMELVKLPYAEIQKSLKPVRQILIVEGHDLGSFFLIQPVKQLSSQDEGFYGIEKYKKEEISIREYIIREFLYYFLEKYFDKEFKYICRGCDCENRFEWSLEPNIYTYDTVRAMIAEIQTVADTLRNDFDNPALAEVKRRFRPSTFVDNWNRRAVDITPEEKNEIFRANIDIVIDFYERFCRRMESMMAHAPQYNQISFLGP